MPSKEIIANLNLKASTNKTGHWLNQNNETIFFDPSLYEDGSSYGFIKADALTNWLDKNNMMIVWLIGGEKWIVPHSHTFSEKITRSNFSGFYKLDNNKEIKGKTWFIDDE